MSFVFYGLLQRLPDSMLSTITFFCQVTRLTQFLDIQEVNLAILQFCFVERIVIDDFQTTYWQLESGFTFYLVH